MIKRQKTFVLLVIGLLVGIMLCEVSIRVMHKLWMAGKSFRVDVGSSESYTIKSQSYHSYEVLAEMDYNTYLGYIPKRKYVGKGYATNNSGFRYDHDFLANKPDNELRIFITGGSTAWGAGVKQDQLYSVIAEKILQKRYPQRRLRVISAGVGAYCSTQERILIENIIISLKPDYIVMFSGWNDAYYGYVGTDITFEQDHMNYSARLSGNHAREQKFARVTPPAYDKYWLKTRYLFDKARYKIRFMKREDLSKEIMRISLSKDKVAEALLRNIHIVNDLSNRYKFKLVFYLQPTIHSTKKRLTIWEERIKASAEVSGVGFSDYNTEAYAMYRKLLPADAENEGYYFIDGDDAIRDEEKSVFVDQVHFGDRGNRLIAHHMAKVIGSPFSEHGLSKALK